MYFAYNIIIFFLSIDEHLYLLQKWYFHLKTFKINSTFSKLCLKFVTWKRIKCANAEKILICGINFIYNAKFCYEIKRIRRPNNNGAFYNIMQVFF